jgi:hypothetical protein
MQEEMIIRRCSTCKQLLNFKPDGTQEGVFCCDLYYHEGACLYKSFNDDIEQGERDWNEHYDDDGDCYYTEWEPELIETEEGTR